MTHPSPLVDTGWLAERLSDDNIRPVDGSWYMQSAKRDTQMEFESLHIPGAVHFAPDVIADLTSDLAHMAASPEIFSEAVGELGIAGDDVIVVYDSSGLFSAARVWWNFRIMGAENCFVLDGGLPKWLAENHPTSSGAAKPTPAKFVAQPMTGMAVTRDQLLSSINGELASGLGQIVDVRSAGRFEGSEPEPRAGLRSGHMPGSKNLPFTDLVENGRLLGADDIRNVLSTAEIDPDKPIVSSCGSGITAPIFNLALARIGVDALQVYDGSWLEWGSNPDLPIVGADGRPV
jgi:thiosulfate/3-mercaptopyruvate sulfurtransferase